MVVGFVGGVVGSKRCVRRNVRMGMCGRVGEAAVRGAAGLALALAVGCGSAVRAELHEWPSQFASVQSDDAEDVKFRVVWEGYRSYNSMYGTVILFHNESRDYVDVNWINYSGREVNYAVVPPGESVLQPTFASHPWTIREHISQAALALTVADDGASVVTISDDGTSTTIPQTTAKDPLLLYVSERI